MRTIIAAGLLALAPTLALAGACNWDHFKEETATTCETGQVFDEKTGTCVNSTS